MNAPSAPELSEVSWHPFLPRESFCKGSLCISEDAFIAVVVHAQQTWLLEPQGCLQSCLQPPGEGSLLGGQKQIWDQSPLALLQIPPVVIWPRAKHLQGLKSSGAQRLSQCHISRVHRGLGRGAQQLQGDHCSSLALLAAGEHEQQLPEPIHKLLMRIG